MIRAGIWKPETLNSHPVFNTVLSPLVELSESLLRLQFSKIISDICLSMLSLFFQGSAFESQLVPAEEDLFQKVKHNLAQGTYLELKTLMFLLSPPCF